MATTTLHFGPEWMRTKHQPPSRAQPNPPSPPPSTSSGTPSGASTYSALVSSAPPPQAAKHDDAHPFRYSKDEMLRIYKEGGGKGGLGLEVERWEGVVRDVVLEPISLREMSEAEKKLFVGPLNSENRRRQPTDHLHLVTSSVDRPRLNHTTSAVSPARERFGSYMGKRRDSTDQPPPNMPRKLSHSATLPPLVPLRETSQPSPRTRSGFGASFDGVLNGAESWVGRRKASEGLAKLGAPARAQDGPGTSESDSKAVLVAHEEERDTGGGCQAESGNEGGRQAEVDPPSLGPGVAKLSIDDAASPSLAPDVKAMPTVDVVTAALAAGPPPGLPDPGSTEWSYLDPQGDVQGPFRADLMQKWYDDGYFSHDLLMKRTRLDTEWTSLGELGRRVGGGKIFLTSLAPPPSVPFASQPDSHFQNYPTPSDQNGLKGPVQPTPSRLFRATTLDSFLGTTSSLSNSPSSSYSVGRFGSGSGDSMPFSGGPPVTSLPGESPVGGRSTSYPAISGSPAAFLGLPGGVPNERLPDPPLAHASPLGSFGTTQVPSVDNYGFNGSYNPHPSGWPTPSAHTSGPSFEIRAEPTGMYTFLTPNPPAHLSQGLAFNHRPVPESDLDGHDVGVFASGNFASVSDPGALHEQQLPTRTILEERLPGLGFDGGYSAAGRNVPLGPSASQPFMSSPSYVPPQHEPSGPPLPFEQPLTHTTKTSQPPWNTQYEPPMRRPGTYDPPFPTASNTSTHPPAPAPQVSPWNRAPPVVPATLPHDASPWLIASQGAMDDSWKDISTSNNLTFSNVGLHNQQELAQQGLANPVPPVTIPQPLPVPEQSPVEPPQAVIVGSAEAKATPPSGASRARRKSTTAQQPIPHAAPPAVPQQPLPIEEVPGAPQMKLAWSKDSETKKAAQPGVAMGLREIQEAEEQKAQARKAAEKARESAARNVVSTPPSNDLQKPFTTSWGLTASHAGAARNHASSKDTPTPPAGPVWTAAAKTQPAKKSMKEIQEEEEKRKKLGLKEVVASAAARRLHGEAPTKSIASQLAGGTWTTVGMGGKPSVPVASSKPPVAPSASTANTASTGSTRANGSTTNRSTPSPVIVKPIQASSSKAEDFPVPPSHEFLKWLTDSLKGLNNTVNIEEIMSMLLSFPIDPDAATVEIVSDLIYANSTTLDGRRFASEFVTKRKADAASRPKGASAGGSAAKPISIADVVKAQPKPTQPEWGGFKVVNKKKKGGRA